jgi:iron complex outermembrane receptor protein
MDKSARNYPLEDIDRIEVISGPGGALWGSNSVNGIINVITKSSGATQGALVDVIGGNLDNIATLRYGGKIGEETTFRIYGMGMQRGHLQTMTGAAAKDDWDKLQGGFRADWTRGADAVTIQGDMFKGTAEDQPSALQNGAISGANILSRWTHQVTDSSELQTQFYYSRTQRDVTSGITARYDSYDLDVQYSFDAPWGQRFVAGGGYRVTMDDFIRGPSTVFLDPAERTLRLANGFIQDQIALNDTGNYNNHEQYFFTGTYTLNNGVDPPITGSGTATINPVPEPATAALFVGGLALILLARIHRW